MQNNKIELYYEGKTYQVEEHTLDTLIEHEYAKHLFEGYKSKLENTGLVLEYKDVLIKEAKKLARENAKKRRAIEEGLGDKLKSIGTGIKNAYNNAGGASGIWQKTKDKVKQGFSLAGRATGTAPGNFISGMKDSWLAKRYKINSQELNDYMIKFAATAKTDVDKAKRILYKKLLQKGVPTADVMKFITQAEEHAKKLGMGQKAATEPEAATAATPDATTAATADTGAIGGFGGGGRKGGSAIGGFGGGPLPGPSTGDSGAAAAPTSPTTTSTPAAPAAPAAKPAPSGGKFLTSSHVSQLTPGLTSVVKNKFVAASVVQLLDGFLYKKFGRLAEGAGNIATKAPALADEFIKSISAGGNKVAKYLSRDPSMLQNLKAYLVKFIANPKNVDLGRVLMGTKDARVGMSADQKAKLAAMKAAQGAAPTAPAASPQVDIQSELDAALSKVSVKKMTNGKSTVDVAKPIVLNFIKSRLGAPLEEGKGKLKFVTDLSTLLRGEGRIASNDATTIAAAAFPVYEKTLSAKNKPATATAVNPAEPTAAPAALAKAPSKFMQGVAQQDAALGKTGVAEEVRRYLKEHKII